MVNKPTKSYILNSRKQCQIAYNVCLVFLLHKNIYTYWNMSKTQVNFKWKTISKRSPTPLKKGSKMKARNMSRSVEDPGYGRRGDTLGNRRTQNRPIDPDDFFGDTLGSPKSGGTLNRNFGLPPSLQERVKAQLPLPKLGLSSPWWLKTGRTYFSPYFFVKSSNIWHIHT
jgi:hypothetical protein